MCKEAQIEKEELMKEREINQEKEAAIHARLESLQNWNSLEDPQVQVDRAAYRETRIRQWALNEQLQQEAQQQVAQAQAQTAVAGTPVQEQTPAKLSYKQRRELKRKAKVAQKKVPGGTVESYDLQKTTGDLVQRRRNSADGYEAEALEKHVDLRALRVFCSGYQVNRWGRPATKEDEVKKEQDQKMMEDYLSMDVERRIPHLERLRKEIMEFKVTEDTISDANIMQNVEELKQITDRSCYFENALKDPVNARYLNEFSAEEQEVMKRKMDVLATLGGYLVNKCMTYGVQVNRGEYLEEIPAEASINAEAFRFTLGAQLKQLVPECMKAVEPVVERMAREERPRVMYRLQQDKIVRGATDEPGIQLTQETFDNKAYDRMRALREMIAGGADAYDGAYHDTIEALYQEAYRTMDLYNDLWLDTFVYQRVVGRFDAGGNFYDRIQKKAALQKVNECQTSCRNCEERMDTIASALNFCMKGGELSDEARELLAQMGAEQLERQKAARDAAGDGANSGVAGWDAPGADALL